jgi:hypothetical protein
VAGDGDLLVRGEVSPQGFAEDVIEPPIEDARAAGHFLAMRTA